MNATAGSARMVLLLGACAALLVSISACTRTTLEERGYGSSTTTTSYVWDWEEGGTDTTTSTDAPAGSRDDEAVEETGSRPVVTLIDAGAEPRQKLRFKLSEGEVQSSEITVSMTIQSTMTGVSDESIDQAVPTISMPVTAAVIDVDAKGSAQIEATYDAITLGEDGNVDDRTRGLLEDQYAAFDGITIAVTQSNRGDLIYADMSDFETAVGPSGANLTSQLSNLTVPLPAEEVGVGATWTVTSELEVPPLSMQQTSTYTIESLDNDIVTMSVAVDQQLAPGTSDLGPVGAIEQYSMSGSGETVIDLTKPFPVGGTSTADQEMVVAAPSGETGGLEQHMHVVTVIGPAD